MHLIVEKVRIMIQNKRVLFFPLTILLGIASFVTTMMASAEQPSGQKDEPPMVKCYQAAIVDQFDETLEGLNMQLEQLEKEYKNKTITEKTYNLRKNYIKNKINSLKE